MLPSGADSPGTPAPRRPGSRRGAAICLIAVLAAACSTSSAPRTPGSTGTPGPTRGPSSTASLAPAGASASGGLAPPSGSAASSPPTFSEIHLSGEGDAAPTFTIPQQIPALATITNTGSGPFVVWTLDQSGSKLNPIVASSGAYSGTVLFDAAIGEFAIAFDVTSGGRWTIDVKPLEQAATWSGTGSLAGHGDDVRLLDAPTPAVETVAITNAGKGPFRVRNFSLDGGSNLLVNAIGTYSGQHLLPAGTIVLEVNSDGPWKVTIEP